MNTMPNHVVTTTLDNLGWNSTGCPVMSSLPCGI
jgi:hypothetical protein